MLNSEKKIRAHTHTHTRTPPHPCKLNGRSPTKNGDFNQSKMFAVHKSTKVMYEVLKLGRIHSISINCQLDLFDKMIKPTLLYGCEIWGLGNIEIIERVHIQFCKLLLQLKNSTPTYMIYGELGRYPIVLDVKI